MKLSGLLSYSCMINNYETGQSLGTFTTTGLLANIPAPLYSAVSPEMDSLANNATNLVSSVVGSMASPDTSQLLHSTNIGSSTSILSILRYV